MTIYPPSLIVIGLNPSGNKTITGRANGPAHRRKEIRIDFLSLGKMSLVYMVLQNRLATCNKGTKSGTRTKKGRNVPVDGSRKRKNGGNHQSRFR